MKVLQWQIWLLTCAVTWYCRMLYSVLAAECTTCEWMPGKGYLGHTYLKVVSAIEVGNFDVWWCSVAFKTYWTQMLVMFVLNPVIFVWHFALCIGLHLRFSGCLDTYNYAPAPACNFCPSFSTLCRFIVKFHLFFFIPKFLSWFLSFKNLYPGHPE